MIDGSRAASTPYQEAAVQELRYACGPANNWAAISR
jgi:hypothetical protein